MTSHAAILAPPPRPLALPRGERPWRLVKAALRSGLFVSLCAAALSYETALIVGVAPQPPRFYLFVFCATWASYRLQSLRPAPGVPRSRVLTTWAVLATVAATGPTLPRAMWPAIAAMAVLAWGYTLPALPGARRLREYGLAKILILSAVWTLATTLLPLVDRPIDAGALVLLLSRRFLFVFTLCVAFDVRDRADDARAGILTLPVRLGVRRSYALMRLTLLALAALIVFGPRVSRTGAVEPVNGALLLSVLATWVAVEASRWAVRSRWFYLGFVDGMMLLQALLVWVMLWTTRR